MTVSQFEAEKRRNINQSHWNNTTILTVLKKKEATDVLTARRQAGWPKKIAAVDERNFVRTVKKNPKITVSDITNDLHRTG